MRLVVAIGLFTLAAFPAAAQAPSGASPTPASPTPASPTLASPTLASPPPGASACSGCHPPAAVSGVVVPPLHGRPAAEIVTQMAAFASGAQASTVMGRIAKGFTDDEVKAIAAWYAAQK